MQKNVAVTKEVTFDCAHMLSGHEALCKNLHGHTYKVLVSVCGTQINGGSSDGMVIDFKHLKSAITEVIMDTFDHAVIFSSPAYRGEAEQELYSWAMKHKMRMFVMPSRTTAENMSKYFREAIHAFLVDKLGLTNIEWVSVKVYETPTSYAEV